MSEIAESERIDGFVDGEQPPSVWVSLSANCGEDSHSCLERVKDVMRLISIKRVNKWPDDEEWESILPPWFVEPTVGRTLDEIMANPHFWDFASWLDAIRSPGWEWWSSVSMNGAWKVHLTAFQDPYSIGPLEYLARTAGAKTVDVTEPEMD